MTSKRNALMASLCAVALLGGCLLVFFHPAIFQKKVIAPLDIMASDGLLRPWASDTHSIPKVHNAFGYDAISYFLPYDYFVYQSLRQDGHMGWTPFTYNGHALCEDTMICPGDWHHHLYRFLDFWTGWNWGIILQFFIAGLGVIVLLRHVMRKSLDASAHAYPFFLATGAISYAFYSQFVLWIYHRWVLGAMCWAPWIVWALHRALPCTVGHRSLPCAAEHRALPCANEYKAFSLVRYWARTLLLPGALLALGIRGGHLQTCLFIFLLYALCFLVQAWEAAMASPDRWTGVCRKLLFHYVVIGIVGVLFSADVLMDTLPPFLAGGKPLDERPFSLTLRWLPTLVTSFFPAILGTPQTLDLTKVFGTHLFVIKFTGCVPLILALLALFRREAPRLPKVLLVVSLLLAFTPAVRWLYGRSTCIFALGVAWLAVWYLLAMLREPPSRRWRIFAYILGGIAIAWLVGSFAVTLMRHHIEPRMHAAVLSALPADRVSRTAWMMARCSAMFSRSMVWHPYNLLTLCAIGTGLYACSRLHTGTRTAFFAVLLMVSVFGEHYLFATTWIRYANRPDPCDVCGEVYPHQAWAHTLRDALGNGALVLHDRSDIDYMPLNTLSAYGIRCAQKYGSIMPPHLAPREPQAYTPSDYAQAGVSGVLVPPNVSPPELAHWDKVLDTQEFGLYKNPAFRSIFMAHTQDGELVPVFASATENSTVNRIALELPPETLKLAVAMSYHRSWFYALDDGTGWHPVHDDGNNGIVIPFASPPSSTLTLRFKPYSGLP